MSLLFPLIQGQLKGYNPQTKPATAYLNGDPSLITLNDIQIDHSTMQKLYQNIHTTRNKSKT